jgi:catechol 2,3-dioxygenase-like lactoylglutathione lyase family enzyme
MLNPMIRQIAPQFFTTDIPATLAYYRDKLGFDCLSTWQDPPVFLTPPGRWMGLPFATSDKLNSRQHRARFVIATHLGGPE